MHTIKLNSRCSRCPQQIGEVLGKLIVEPSLIVEPGTTTKRSLVVVTPRVRESCAIELRNAPLRRNRRNPPQKLIGIKALGPGITVIVLFTELTESQYCCHGRSSP